MAVRVETPRIDRKRFGRRAGKQGGHARAHGAGNKNAATEQRAAIDKAVASNKWRKIAATTIANAHDVLLADRRQDAQ